MTDSSKRDIVRKKFSLTIYHDELLEKIVEQRYASRSEAVRAAIQHHTQYLNEDEETGIESIQTDLEQITELLNTIQERLEGKSSGVVVSEQTPDLAGNEVKSEMNPGVQEVIAKALSEKSPLSVDEIAERTGEDIISVIPSINSLQDDGIIRPVSEDAERYELNR